jgi:hypothetical protein
MRIATGDLYVSSVEGFVVGRFGSGTSLTKGQNIGVYPTTKTTVEGETVFDGLRWDTDEVVLIPRAEYLAHLKAYDQELSADALKVRTKDDYDAWLKRQAAASKKDEPPKAGEKPAKPEREA